MLKMPTTLESAAPFCDLRAFPSLPPSVALWGSGRKSEANILPSPLTITSLGLAITHLQTIIAQPGSDQSEESMLTK